jgi:cyclopropane fatty-acyl-phospholipid synthase-like methyltransferase
VSRRWSLPCPHWMAWVLDNPYSAALAGSTLLLDRADVRPGMRVLDLGCGPGRIAIPAAERVGQLGNVVAVDVQQTMLDEVQTRAEQRGITHIRTVRAAVKASLQDPSTGCCW